MNNVCEDLHIPKQNIQSTVRENRVVAIVHRSWIKALLKHGQLQDVNKTNEFMECPYAGEEIGQSWVKVFITFFKKCDKKVIPLPRIRGNVKNEPPLSLCQLLQFVSQTNYKNLWKESYKKYNCRSNNSKDTQLALAEYNEVLREIIVRTYGCPIVNTYDNSLSIEHSKYFDVHLNIMPAICGVETIKYIYLIHMPYIKHNLQECITFSPAILGKCYTKPLFVIYQLLQTLKSMHDRSLTLGEIELSDIYLTEDLWIYIFPQLTSNIYIHELPEIEVLSSGKTSADCRKSGHSFDIFLKCHSCGIRTYDKFQIQGNESLDQLCHLWTEGQISNFTYLTCLNNLSGRKFGNPNCHHVFPWVTDFASRNGKNWRDLKKSKYRLNKGDRQLDLTYETSQSEIPHHVSDVLSSITYYVYMSRRTPKSVLCKHVRPVWVPEEYPSSITRLQEWSPDECIPEFYSDPTIFKTIHDDLDDLDVPNWSSSPEDFIEQHREALESSYVSERLHHWIDLTFGYKLAGHAAIKAKNVCLQLVDDHSDLTDSGLVQLFSYPHPPKLVQSPFWNKSPPKILVFKDAKNRGRDRSVSSVQLSDISRSEDDEESSQITPRTLAITKILSRSRQSLNEESKDQKFSRSPSSNQRSASLGPKTPTFTLHVPPRTRQLSVPISSLSSGIIYLPKEYNPVQILAYLENIHTFFTKTFHKGIENVKTAENKNQKTSDIPQLNEMNDTISDNLQYDDFVKNSFTNLIFAENFEESIKNRSCLMKSHSIPVETRYIYKCRSSLKTNNEITCNYAEIIASRRTKELHILGCLITEIFLFKQLRTLKKANGFNNFKNRLESVLLIIKACTLDIPSCIRHVIQLLLPVDIMNNINYRYPAVSDIGLPPLTAHILLEPLLNYVIPFSKHFLNLYSMLSDTKDFVNTTEELNIFYYFDCNGSLCQEYENLEKTKSLLLQNISECKVKLCAQQLDSCLKHLNMNRDCEIVKIIVPHVKQLIEDPSTSVLACWYLFDPIARVLGPKLTTENFLQPILKLYENTITFNRKIAKLYHHSFLLRLIVRFGLRTFLENFITPLVETVGGYRNIEKMDNVLHIHSENVCAKSSNLKLTVTEQTELSSSDDSSSSERKSSSFKEASKDQNEYDIFEYENEILLDTNEPMQSLIEHLEHNVSTDLPFNHSGAEEALDALDDEHIRNLDELHLNLSEDDEETTKDSISSPTVPIPMKNLHGKEVNNISCSIGGQDSESVQSDNILSPIHSKIPEISNISANPAPNKLGQTSKNKYSETEISEMSSDSLLWLAHRLGPVLTARYLTRNLLKMLTLCYVGKENLAAVSSDNMDSFSDSSDIITITNCYIIGDKNAVKVLECLSNIAALYGEQIIVLQYLPHMGELIALCKKRLTVNLEGSLISCLALLKHIIPYLSDSLLMDQLHDIILKNIIHPTVRLLGSTKFCFPSGAIARSILAKKYLDTLYVLSIRMGADMTRIHLSVPALQRFFLIFEKIHENGYKKPCINLLVHESQAEDTIKSLKETNLIEVKKDYTTTELTNSGKAVNISHIQIQEAELSADSSSPSSPKDIGNSENTVLNQATNELREVFTTELAHTAYIPFLKQIGTSALEQSLKNYSTIHSLCQKYENNIREKESEETAEFILAGSANFSHSSFTEGSRIHLVGNRIDVHTNEDAATKNADLLSLISSRMENSVRHLRGNWLAYWEHEIGRSDKDTMFNFKQIKLQTFTGHTNSIKSLFVLDNENSFLSGSRDKTVKLWSLRSQGDGSQISTCQSTYTAHRKSVLSITFLESMRLCASCDSVVHIWDPFMGGTLKQMDSPKNAPVNIIKEMPAPSCLLFTATTEGTIKVIDVRLCSYVQELKVTLNPTGYIRCLAIPPSGNWIAAGQSSGNITVLDSRTGLVLATWRAHESDILQMVAFGENTLVSSSFDQAISVWNVHDGKFKHSMKGTTEPVHCLNLYNSELISGTTANRIGVHTSVENDASFSSTKLRSDTFKGLLTSTAILPLNRLLLLGADNGNISLLC